MQHPRNLTRAFLIVCVVALLQSHSEAFGCSPEMCSYFPYLSSVCCLFGQQCCKEVESSNMEDSASSNCVQIIVASE